MRESISPRFCVALKYLATSGAQDTVAVNYLMIPEVVGRIISGTY